MKRVKNITNEVAELQELFCEIAKSINNPEKLKYFIAFTIMANYKWRTENEKYINSNFDDLLIKAYQLGILNK